MTLLLQSGRRLFFGIDHPHRLLDLLAQSGIATGAARERATVVWAAHRAPWRWGRLILKFPVIGVLPGTLLFYTHQHIAYGGTFGQWNLEGLGPYLHTWLEYWSTTTVLLLSWASCWRGPGETIVWLVAATAPRAAATTRRVVDTICALAYYVGVPVLLALRYSA